MDAKTEPSRSLEQATGQGCVRCGGWTIAGPWCAGCTFTIEGSEIDPGSEHEAEIEPVFTRLVGLYADYRLEIIPELFLDCAVIRYPRSGLTLAGVEAVENWYAAAFKLAPKLGLDHVYQDDGSVWALYSVSLPAAGWTESSTGNSAAASQAYVAHITLRDLRIATMDVYRLNYPQPSSPVAVATASPNPSRVSDVDLKDSGDDARRTSDQPRNLRRNHQRLRSLLPRVAIVAIIGSIVAALLPRLNPSTGVNTTVGFGPINGAALAVGVVLLVLYAALVVAETD